jgi:hypothetical protein
VIDTYQCSKLRFDYQELKRRFEAFLSAEDDPAVGFDDWVCVFKEWGAPPMPGMNIQATLDEMVDDGLRVFLPVHFPTLDEPVLCIDLERRDPDDFDIGVSDSYGFVLELDGENVLLHPALYDGTSGPIPRIYLQATCSCMEEPMRQFALHLGCTPVG